MEDKLDLSGYLRVMQDVLVRKKKVLTAIYEATKEQENALRTEDIDEAVFNDAMDRKTGLIGQLNEMDEGFQKLFEKISPEIKEKAAEHGDVIHRLQVLIQELTDLSVTVTALEKKNKDTLERRADEIRKGKKSFKVSRQTADKYYKSMNGLNAVTPVFLDEKH
ncbi:MAG: flagellar export chaperone FlgN [Lachnospiraceae bacterium]|nr:flagellar export chaperone FlgN [Lachnospiraceae bacterium]